MTTRLRLALLAGPLLCALACGGSTAGSDPGAGTGGAAGGGGASGASTGGAGGDPCAPVCAATCERAPSGSGDEIGCLQCKYAAERTRAKCQAELRAMAECAEKEQKVCGADIGCDELWVLWEECNVDPNLCEAVEVERTSEYVIDDFLCPCSAVPVVAPPASCTSPADCPKVCCSCGEDTINYTLQRCVGGACVPDEGACAFLGTTPLAAYSDCH